MTDEENKDKANTEEENQDIDDDLVEDMEEFVVALNRFVNLVNSLEWPEHFPLDADQKQCFSVFRTFWRQRERQRRENRGRRGVHMRFEGLNKEDVHRFFRNRFTLDFLKTTNRN